ncbi:hypothetical protein GQ55_3G226000 [Panicum hallii var. hallii]|uniref:Uncharacterized protein n=1 Tax=Panicum hallii var. hallii TaxID=1504633 RepID=A0A2T7ECC1_9POAL|nr:hypothetical protein GQ55_3G226000 [Panicum hallii var. hallii]
MRHHCSPGRPPRESRFPIFLVASRLLPPAAAAAARDTRARAPRQQGRHDTTTSSCACCLPRCGLSVTDDDS